MEENKNLTPDNEENTEETVEITEEVIEETEEVVEETETTEEATEEATEEVEDTVDFAEVAPETEEEEKPKKSKGGVVASVILICAVVALILALAVTFFFKSGSTEGTGNIYSEGFAAVHDGEVYYINLVDNKIYKTDLADGEAQLAIENEGGIYLNIYDGDMYYLGVDFNEETAESVISFNKYVDGTNDIALVKDSTMAPQLSGGYVYYLKSVPEFYSGYCSRIYRAKLSENSEPELVCDVLCNAFYVDGEDLYYGDVETTTFMKATIANAMKAVKEAPLAEGGKRASSEIGAEVVLSEAVTGFPTVYKGVLYYIDSLNQGEFRAFDLKSGEDKSFNTGVFASRYNIYGDYIYYSDQTDACTYRMNLDGSDVRKITAPGNSGMILSDDKFISMVFDEIGYPYYTICDLEGNVVKEIDFKEELDEFISQQAEMEETTETAEGEADATEEAEEVVEEAEETATDAGIETAVDVEE